MRNPFKKSATTDGSKISEMQVDLDVVLSASRLVGSNRYTERAAIIGEIIRKYRGVAERGNQLVGRIIDTRAAFALGAGIGCQQRKEVESGDCHAELDFIRRFLELNGLDGGTAQQLSREKEFEGQLCLVLANDSEADNVSAEVLSWFDTRYEINLDPRRYSRVINLIYGAGDPERRVALPPERFVFFRFNNRINSAEGVPNLAGLLTECESLDRALTDWRSINHYFASPTPFFRCSDAEQAKDLQARLAGANWKIGKALAANADFSFVGIDSAGVESLQHEIETLVKVISAGSGVPVQYLGFPEFMSNRSTAENTLEPVSLVAQSEQQSWRSGFAELFDKAIEIHNRATGGALRPGLIQPSFSFANSRQLQLVEKIYMPLLLESKISLETFLGLLPGVDAQRELKRLGDSDEGEQ
jgi:hypothetical protein